MCTHINVYYGYVPNYLYIPMLSCTSNADRRSFPVSSDCSPKWREAGSDVVSHLESSCGSISSCTTCLTRDGRMSRDLRSTPTTNIVNMCAWVYIERTAAAPHPSAQWSVKRSSQSRSDHLQNEHLGDQVVSRTRSNSVYRLIGSSL